MNYMFPPKASTSKANKEINDSVRDDFITNMRKQEDVLANNFGKKRRLLSKEKFEDLAKKCSDMSKGKISISNIRKGAGPCVRVLWDVIKQRKLHKAAIKKGKIPAPLPTTFLDNRAADAVYKLTRGFLKLKHYYYLRKRREFVRNRLKELDLDNLDNIDFRKNAEGYFRLNEEAKNMTYNGRSIDIENTTLTPWELVRHDSNAKVWRHGYSH